MRKVKFKVRFGYDEKSIKPLTKNGFEKVMRSLIKNETPSKISSVTTSSRIEKISLEFLKSLIDKKVYPITCYYGDEKLYIYEVDDKGLYLGTSECDEEKKKYLENYFEKSLNKWRID